MELKWVGTMSQRVAMLALTTRNVCTGKENLAHVVLTHFASRLDSLAFLLKEMQRDAELRNADYTKLEKGKLDEQVEAMEKFLDSYSDKCSLYLLSSCPQIIKQVQMSSKALVEALDSVMQNAGCTAMKLRIAQVKEGLELAAASKLDAKQQSILDALEPELLESLVADSGRCTKIAQQIAESLELSVDSEQFQKELVKLKENIKQNDILKRNAQPFYLEQFLILLEKGVMEKSKPTSEVGAERLPLVREVTMRSTPLTPLQSFICPITRDVMRDPVQIASGQTFEREAIERWFAKGHTRCPLGTELKNTKMKSNIALRQSIAEWRDRNFEIRIGEAEANLKSSSLEDQGKAVQELQRICEEYSMNKYTIASRGLIPALVRLAETKNPELRTKTLAALRTLAQENVGNQEIMVEEGIIDMLVRCLARCLARRREESEQAILILLLLSKIPTLAEKISHAHGAVIHLVTQLGSEHEEMAANVKEILENLPPSDENIVVMAQANLMKPLVTRLVEGSPSSKLVMARTLAELQMPETSKIQTATQESICTLLNMARSNDEDEKVLALAALRNLTTIREVCVLAIKAKPSGPEVLVPLLHSTKSSVAVRTSACSVMANLMTSLGEHWEPDLGEDLQVETLVGNCLTFYFPPPAQAQVLRGLLGLVNGKDTGDIAKASLIERDALNLLVPLLSDSGVDAEVRKYAVQIYACLSMTDKEAAAAALTKYDRENFTHLVTMLKVRDTKSASEKLAAMTILANLPLNDDQITRSLLQVDCIPLLVKYLGSREEAMQEAAAGALLRFTVPNGPDMQLRLAEQGVVQRFVTLLDSTRSLTQERAAKALTNFSKSSSKLSVPVARRPFYSCFSVKIETCSLHKGACKVETSFCMKEADAVPALLTVLKEGAPCAAEAAMETLLTLVEDDYEPGVHLIVKCKGIPMIKNVLSSGTKASQEMGVLLVEKIFRVQEYRKQYSPVLQMHIITVAQRGSQKAKQIAGKVLRQLDLLQSQSNYFGHSRSA